MVYNANVVQRRWLRVLPFLCDLRLFRDELLLFFDDFAARCHDVLPLPSLLSHFALQTWNVSDECVCEDSWVDRD